MTNDKQRERLVELLEKTSCAYQKCIGDCIYECKFHRMSSREMNDLADFILADGWMRPPCKVGQTVYRVVVMSTGVTRVFKKTLCPPYECGVIVDCKPTVKRFIRSVTVTKNNFLDVVENWDKTVFLTKEEAEKALKGGVQG